MCHRYWKWNGSSSTAFCWRTLLYIKCCFCNHQRLVFSSLIFFTAYLCSHVVYPLKVLCFYVSEQRLMHPNRNTGHKRALDVTSVVQGKTKFFSVMMLAWGMYCIILMLPFSKLQLITLVVLLRGSSVTR